MPSLLNAKGTRLLCVLALYASMAAAADSKICQMEYCYPGGPQTAGKISTTSKSVSVPPCFQLSGTDYPSCFDYGADRACPFPGMVDCSKEAKATTSPPTTTPPTTTTGAANTTTVVPTTGAGNSTDQGSTSGSTKGSTSQPKIWPYVVGGGVALVAIAILVIVMVKKSSRTAEEDDIDTVEYAKPIPTSSSGNFKNDGQMPIPRPGYNNSFIQPPPTAVAIPEPEKPYAARANPSFNQGPVVRQNPSFLNRTQSNTYGNAFPQAQAVPPVYTTNTSFGPNAAPIRRESHEAGRVEPPAPMPKEQFYVPQVELHFGEHEEPSGRRESYEF